MCLLFRNNYFVRRISPQYDTHFRGYDYGIDILGKLEWKASEICSNEMFSQNSKRKNYFLAACYLICADVNLKEVNDHAPFGGIIGMGNSSLESVLGKYKVLRLHAIFHDAAGFMKCQYNKGPGYLYILVNAPRYFNMCWIGHITGIIYCIYLAITSPFFRNSKF